MNRRKLCAIARAPMDLLPVIRRPWSVEDVCSRLAKQRDRSIVLHSMQIPALPFGLWYDDGRRDHIIYRADLTNYHRDHVILHEVFHMLTSPATDPRAPGEHVPVAEDPVRTLIEHATMSHHTDELELAAELFATKVLSLVKRLPSDPINGKEQRVAALFGVY